MKTIFRVALLLLSLLSLDALAYYKVNNFKTGVVSGYTYSTATAACQSIDSTDAAFTSGYAAWSWSAQQSSGSNSGYCYPNAGNNGDQNGNWAYQAATCNAPATSDGQGGCACPSGYTFSTGSMACVAQPSCPWGQGYVNGVCSNLCASGKHYARTQLTPIEVDACVDDCPANTFDTTAPGKLSLCSPVAPTNTTNVKSTCDQGYSVIGFDAKGNALCIKNQIADPCPKGTHNIDLTNDPANANCTSNTVSDSAAQSTPKTTDTNSANKTTNSDGSTATTKTDTATMSDGSKLVTTTTTTCDASGNCTSTTAMSGNGGQATAAASAGGSGSSGGGGGGAGGGSGGGSGNTASDGVVNPQGPLYVTKGKTFNTVFQNFSNGFNAAPSVAAAKNFFGGTVSGGSCFNGVINIPYLKTSVDVAQYFCGGPAQAGLNVMAIGLLIGAAYVAFRIAFL